MTNVMQQRGGKVIRDDIPLKGRSAASCHGSKHTHLWRVLEQVIADYCLPRRWWIADKPLNMLMTILLHCYEVWLTVFFSNSIFTIFVMLPECIPTCTFYDRSNAGKKTRGIPAMAAIFRLNKDSLTSVHPLSKHAFPVVKPSNKHSTMSNKILQRHKSSQTGPRSFSYMPLCKKSVYFLE